MLLSARKNIESTARTISPSDVRPMLSRHVACLIIREVDVIRLECSIITTAHTS